MKNILFVCNVNLQRSPTGEEIVNSEEEFQDYDSKSVGISPLAEKQINENAIKWADIVFCMEEFQKQFILKNFQEIIEDKNKNTNFKIINLEIPDKYYRNDPELKKMIRNRIKKYLNEKK
mgnify:CR=1 FL=1